MNLSKKEEARTDPEHKELMEKMEIPAMFKDVKLLELIKGELDKDHLGDDQLKMTTFLVAVSALLKNPKRRQSLALTGDTSTGKDNMQRSVLKHMPDGSYIFLTSATQATIEDDIKDKRIVAISEVNLFREGGANKHLLEVLKQRTEGGTSIAKKDVRNQNKTTRYENAEQGTVIFGTTETEKDSEFNTRLITGTVTVSPSRIKKVNENTLDSISHMDEILKEKDYKPSFIKQGLTKLFTDDIQFEIVLPYAYLLKEKINDKDIFDHSNPRSQRDIKRLLALTCATTLIHKYQRTTHKVDDEHWFLISEPQDLINTLKYSQDFFDQTYSGRDGRINQVLKAMKEIGGVWIDRNDIMTKLDVSKNTITSYCKVLSAEGVIKGSKGNVLNEEAGMNIYNNGNIYYTKGQKRVKKRLIRVQLEELTKYLEENTEKSLTPYLITHTIEDKKDDIKGQSKGVKSPRDVKEESKKEEIKGKSDVIDPPNLTPFPDKLNVKEEKIE